MSIFLLSLMASINNTILTIIIIIINLTIIINTFINIDYVVLCMIFVNNHYYRADSKMLSELAQRGGTMFTHI